MKVPVNKACCTLSGPGAIQLQSPESSTAQSLSPSEKIQAFRSVGPAGLGDLERPHLQQRVLELDITVHNAHFVAVVQPEDELLEKSPAHDYDCRRAFVRPTSTQRTEHLSTSAEHMIFSPASVLCIHAFSQHATHFICALHLRREHFICGAHDLLPCCLRLRVSSPPQGGGFPS